MEDAQRLEIALRRAQAALAAKRNMNRGIGTESERMLHCVLKYYFEPDEAWQEVKIGSNIADIYRPQDNRVLEIQTRGFDRLRKKLDAFLPDYKVTVVFPVVREKYLHWVDPETGVCDEGRRSPKKGRELEILPEIYRLPDHQMHPNLSFLPVMMDVHEYRIKDGYAKEGKKGSHRLERVPYQMEEGCLLEFSEDYRYLIPDSLVDPFTVKEFAKASGLRGKASYAMKALERAGAIERTGQKGKAYLYSRTED